jgi:uncharacterized protein YigE (DUF2233 family)
MTRIFLAAIVLLSSNIAFALPQEKNTELPGIQVTTVSTLDATETDISMFDDEESETLTGDPQENDTGVKI